MIRLDPQDAAPLWRQLEMGVRRLVASGSLPAGGPVPSVRDMAQDLGVNPATVSKAYQRLTDAGVLEVRRGEGTFVGNGPTARERRDLARELEQSAQRFVAVAKTLGAEEDEAVREVRTAWSALSRTRKGGGA